MSTDNEKIDLNAEDQKKYEKAYDDDGFWKKVMKYAKKAGSGVIEKSLQLYYAAQSPETPLWAKTTIYAALGYFISPIDAIPDVVPVMGYTDDLGVLTAAIASVAMYIDTDVKQKAKEKLEDWFG